MNIMNQNCKLESSNYKINVKSIWTEEKIHKMYFIIKSVFKVPLLGVGGLITEMLIILPCPILLV